MASFSTSTTLKMILVSTGVLTAALALKHTVPVVSDFIVSECPSIWTFMLTCVRPPYLYILMNCIIISIVASSKLHHRHKLNPTHSPDDPVVLLPSIQTLTTAPFKISEDILPTEYKTVVLPPSQNLMQEPILISGNVRTEHAVSNGLVSEAQVYDANVQEPKTPKRKDHKEVVDHVRTSIQRKDSSDLSFQNGNEKPPVSARFGHHRKAVKASPDGGKAAALGVMKAKRHDTLESTWKMITDGRAMPLTRHLKKSDTWDSQMRRNSSLTDQNDTHAVNKSETFNGRSKTEGENASPSSGTGRGRLKKEPSPGQDELNRRVEAFINKFNEEMRLQREESLRQYQEMIRRGAH
ncbi:hypothetical protein QN277_002609 [Acacia crassicarpa]|uniref:DUF4408 domain-containing protein n=1 Tax=Acacia crassicarpa TaxID=499986 RepID=A0AAE1N9W5_9FABA|nr:hypothetical protein QN277_002609 [Acacia crassicarpa]